MRITIDEVTGDGSVIRFTHEAGQADGIWRGESRAVAGPVDVEWSVPGRFWWDDDVRVRPPRSSATEGASADVLPVTGVAAGLSDEGILALHIGDGIVEIQTSGVAPTDLAGQTVEVDSPLIEVFPLDR